MSGEKFNRDNDEIIIKCDWMTLNGENIQKTVTTEYVTETPIPPWPNLEDMVSTERALICTHNSSTSCNIEIIANKNSILHSVSIVSGSRRCELFIGEHHEYSETITGNVIDNFAESIVCRHDIPLYELSNRQITLRFLPRKQELWFYAIHIRSYQNKNIHSTESNMQSINFKNVEKILNSSTRKISQNAEICKFFLQSYSKFEKEAAPPTMQMLMSAMNSNKFNKILDSNVIHNNNKMSDVENASITDCNLLAVKVYIDEKVANLEIRIMERLNELESRQNEKLDKILKILEYKS